MERRSNKTCLRCRQKHVKCDKLLPACTPCGKAKAKPECVYGGLQIRRCHLPTTPSNAAGSEAVTVTATSRVTSERDPDPSIHPVAIESPDLQDTLDRSQSEGRNLRHSSLAVEQQASQSLPIQALAGHSTTSSPSLECQPPPAGHFRSQLTTLYGLNFRASPSLSTFSPWEERHTINGAAQAIVTEEESELFAFYLEHAGDWLDIVSPARCFAQAVPRLALHNPVLYYSCLAYASFALYLRGCSDRAKADHYHNRAISLLIPLLAPTITSTSWDVLLATIVILRMSEQFSEPEDDAQYHMNGAFSLFTSTEGKWLPNRVDVGGVAFWIFVRQHLRICFLAEQECHFDLDIVDKSNMLAPAADEVWTNRVTYLLARICNTCWSTLQTDHPLEQILQELEDDLDLWHHSLPDTFKPWYSCDGVSHVFPQLRYLSRWHVLGWQQYYTAKTMLAVYRQKYQQLDTYRDGNDYLSFKILAPAKKTCGLVFSEPDVGANINGAHLVYWCGQFFTGYEERTRLLQWLKKFMDETKWPNRTCIERLQKIWYPKGTES